MAEQELRMYQDEAKIPKGKTFNWVLDRHYNDYTYKIFRSEEAAKAHAAEYDGFVSALMHGVQVNSPTSKEGLYSIRYRQKHNKEWQVVEHWFERKPTGEYIVSYRKPRMEKV